MLRWHRLCALWLGILLAYVVLTGLGIQLADMRALLSGSSAMDPDMLMMRQHINGPPNYAVISAPDYAAPALPQHLDLTAAIDRTAALAAAAQPGVPLRLVEVREVRGRLAGHVRMDRRDFIFDLASGAQFPDADLPPGDPARGFMSPRAWFKSLHRFNFIGQPATALDLLAGLTLGAMIVTGLAHYARVYRARARIGRKAMVWTGGGRWRVLHRWTALCAALPVLWIMATGIALSLDNVGAFAGSVLAPPPAGPNAFDGDFSSPLPVGQLDAMTRRGLSAYRALHPGDGIKVLRLRIFAGYPQAIIIAADASTTQRVFNARTGAPMTMSEAGYPKLGFPSGWEWHQRLKRMHRGDIVGMPGRWLDTLGGAGLAYLIVSGIVMYVQLYLRRRRAGVAWR